MNTTPQPGPLEVRLSDQLGGTEPERGDLAAECCYCHDPAPGWLNAEAAVGKRCVNGTLEYHCYAGYCWD